MAVKSSRLGPGLVAAGAPVSESEKALVAEEASAEMDDMSLARGVKEADRLLVADEAKEEKRDMPQGEAVTVLLFFLSCVSSVMWEEEGVLLVDLRGEGGGESFLFPWSDPERAFNSDSMSSQNLFKSSSMSMPSS